MLKHILIAGAAALFVIASAHSAFAQFTTATVDGSIGTNEYGVHTEGNNQLTNAGVTWYMTWDATNLYVGISGANITEGAVLYLMTNPQTPVNGGSTSVGSIAGMNYDGVNFAALPFRANFVCYFKSGYAEYRLTDGAGAWSGTANTGFGSLSAVGTVREIAIPWSVMPAGSLPASFLWTGFATNSSGFAYAAMPAENPGGTLGTAARFPRYFQVGTTTSGSATKPFSRNCFIFNQTTSDGAFGDIPVWDFTMNNSTLSITRTAASNWTISGSLRISAGTINFASGGTGTTTVNNVTLTSGTLNLASQTTNTNVSGSLSVTNATLNMNACTGDLNVGGDVTFGSGGTIQLSSVSGADLITQGNFTRNSGGILTPNGRAVVFNGTGKSLTGLTTFDYLLVGATGGLTLQSPIIVNKQLQIASGGSFTQNSNTIQLNEDAALTNGNAGALSLSSAKVTWGNTSGALKTATVSGTVTFGDADIGGDAVGHERVDFGSASTVNGVLQINFGGAVLNNAPVYGASSTLRYNSGGSYNVAKEWDVTPHNVEVSNSTNLNFIAVGDHTAAGNLTIGSGSTFNSISNTQGTLKLQGDFTNSGTFNALNGTVSFEGSANQALAANVATAFQNLTVAAGRTVVESVSADNATVAGTLTNGGTIRKSKTIAGTGAYTLGLTGASVNVTTAATLTSLTVDRVDSNHPNATSRQQTGKYWVFTPNGSPGAFTVDMTLPHSISPNSAAMVCRYDSGTSTWSEGRSSSTSTTVTRTGITQFSPWAVGVIPAGVEDWNLH